MDGMQGTTSYIHKVLARARGVVLPSSLLPALGWQARRIRGAEPDPFENSTELLLPSEAGAEVSARVEASVPASPVAAAFSRETMTPVSAESATQGLDFPTGSDVFTRNPVSSVRPLEPVNLESTRRAAQDNLRVEPTPGQQQDWKSTSHLPIREPLSTVGERPALSTPFEAVPRGVPTPDMLRTVPEVPSLRPVPSAPQALERSSDATLGQPLLKRLQAIESRMEHAHALSPERRITAQVKAEPKAHSLQPKQQPLRHTAFPRSVQPPADSGPRLVIQRLRVEVLPAPAAPQNGAKGKHGGRLPRAAAPRSERASASPLRFGLGQL